MVNKSSKNNNKKRSSKNTRHKCLPYSLRVSQTNRKPRNAVKIRNMKVFKTKFLKIMKQPTTIYLSIYQKGNKTYPMTLTRMMKSRNLVVLNPTKIKKQISKIKMTQNFLSIQIHLMSTQIQRENAPLIVLMTISPNLLNNISKL